MGDRMTNNEEALALAKVIAEVTDLWDEPLDEVHDIPPILNAILAAGFRRLPVSGDNADYISRPSVVTNVMLRAAVLHLKEYYEVRSSHGNLRWIVPDGEVRAALEAALAASQPCEAAPSDADREALAWVDRHNDVWVFPGGGDTGYSFETQPFSREHIEKKWGPLEPLSRSSHPVQVEVTDDTRKLIADARAQVRGHEGPYSDTIRNLIAALGGGDDAE